MVGWVPKTSDFLRAFAEQNPWQLLKSVPASLAPPVERRLAQSLWRRLIEHTPRRYAVVLGPRRVGKTTVLYQTVRHLLSQGIEPSRIWWLRMDHPLLMTSDLGTLVREVIPHDATLERPLYVMLDEIVYADKWDLWLKTFFDEQWPVRIAATSSATAATARAAHREWSRTLGRSTTCFRTRLQNSWIWSPTTSCGMRAGETVPGLAGRWARRCALCPRGSSQDVTGRGCYWR